MAIKNLVTGNFVNAQENYFAAPQQLQNGVIVGHSHVVAELLTSLDQTTATNPRQFAFFKVRIINDLQKRSATKNMLIHRVSMLLLRVAIACVPM